MTSHYFIDQLQAESKAELIDGIKATAEHVKNSIPGIKTVGIIASTGAIKIAIFQKQFQELGINTVILNDEHQKQFFTDPIYESWGIKAGNIKGKPKELINQAVDKLVSLGAEAIIAGCSELPLVLKPEELEVPMVDSIDILVDSAIKRCINKCY